LASRPIGELTVGDIAAAAGVRRSGYYFYFESKYTALAIITSEIWSELMDRARAFVRFDNESVADFLLRTASTAVDVWHTHDAVLVASVQAIPLDEQLADMWRTWNERLAAILTKQVLKDRELGLAHPVSESDETQRPRCTAD
jgi:AcrR family transcriptional regulator